MGVRWAALALGALSLGCHTLDPFGLLDRTTTAERDWRQGQEAMRLGQPEEAVACYQRSLEVNPELTRAYLSLAAAHLERGDEAAACPALAAYVAANPDQLAVRAQLAELFLHLHRPDEARVEFERFSADAQEQGAGAAASLIHCHRRLMELAELSQDKYGEHLHRGIGLFLLARQRAGLPDPDDELPVEALLCKAAAELTLAHRARPEMARPSWYLFEVWTQLSQQQPALRSLRAADGKTLAQDLTPAEQRALQLAWQRQATEARVK